MNPHYPNLVPGDIILKKYLIIHKIADGCFSQIYCAFDRDEGQHYTIKAISKSQLSSSQKRLISGEREIHQQMNHPHIVQMHHVQETRRHLFMILEYVDTDLFYYLNQRGSLSERETAQYFLPLLEAIHYCHLNDIIHRDIKLENVLLTKDRRVKLCDFGFAIRAETATGLCGTWEYLAPEMILEQPYNYLIDIWALGVVLFECLYFSQPFSDHNLNKLLRKIVNHEVVFPKDPWITLSCENLIIRLLDKDPQTRIRYRDLWSHPWISQSDQTISHVYQQAILLGKKIKNRNMSI